MLRWLGLSTGYRPWLHAFVLLLILNIGFLGLLFSSNLMPRAVMTERIRHAFITGELTEQDYLPYDLRRGFHQYNDCNILQMISNPDHSSIERVLGPLLYLADSSVTEVCLTLRELIMEGRDPATLISSRYTRYWHGNIPIISVLLTLLEISTIRMLLRTAVYMAVLLLLLSSVRERRFFLLTGPVAFAGAFFWGLLYFGQGMSHALGDFVVMLGIACLIFWHSKFAHTDTLILFCALFGAVVVYFEMLTGPLPTAAGLLFPTVYLLSRLTDHSDTQIGHHFGLATVAVTAFALSVIFTMGARVAIAATLVHPSELDVFMGHLELYTQPLDSRSYIPGFLRPFGRLLRQGAVLTYGSSWGLAGLYTSAIGAWLTGVWLAWKCKNLLGWADLLAFVTGAASIPIWTIILQTHTFVHAGFMARILIVPISLGWAAMFWQLWLRRATTSRFTIIELSHLTR
jgi:hypothetical protein